MFKRIVKILFLLTGTILVAGVSTYFTLTFFIKLEDAVEVPDLIGKDVVYVLQTLTDLGLNTKVKGSEYSVSIPLNHVIFQEPFPGAEIKKDRDVRIVISKGPKTVLMPNLKGLSLSQARIILEENGLCYGNQSSTYSRTVHKEDIIAHDPVAGRKVDRGSCVDLLVSVGRRLTAYKMPDLKGRPLDETILFIESSRLRMGDIKSVHNENTPRNTIVRQEPQAGYQVFEGSSVHLSVNRTMGNTGGSMLSGISGVGLFRYRLDNGFLKRRIRVRLNSYGVSNDLFDDFVSPGEEIWFLIPKHQDATVLLYVDGELEQTEMF